MTTATRRPSVAGALGFVLLTVLVAVLAWQASTRSVDFPVYHRVARQVLSGNFQVYPNDVYSAHGGSPHGFRYLPVVALLFAPFGLLPLPLSAFLFFMIKLAVLAWMGTAVGRQAGLPNGWRGPLIALLVVAGYLAEELRYGNAHALVIGLMVFAWMRAARGERWWPGTALALAVAMKITPIALVGYWLLRRQVAVSLATLAMIAALMFAPVPIVGMEMNTHLLTGFGLYALEKTEESDNYSLRGALERVFSMPTLEDLRRGRLQSDAERAAARTADRRAIMSWLALSALLGLAAMVVLWRRSSDVHVQLLDFAIVLTLMLIVSPHTQRRYFMQLYVPMIALLPLASGSDRRTRHLARLGLAVTFAAGTLLPAVFGGRTLSRLYESATPYAWAAVVLLLALFALRVTLERRAQRENRSSRTGAKAFAN